MDKERLKLIDNILQQSVDDKFVAGSMALILQDGEEMYFGKAGYSDLAAGKEITRDTIFKLYSMTKPITATAAWILIEDGVIALEDPVSKYIPTYANQTYAVGWNRPAVKNSMTIRDLLNMSSGLCYNCNLSFPELATETLVNEGIDRMGTDNEMSTVEFATRLGELPLLFSPGEGYNYSFSADVLGAVIEIASGMKYSEFLNKRIFEPLGMKDTGFWVPADKRDRFAKAYSLEADGLTEFHYNHLMINQEGDHAPAFESGGAGIMTTLDDYAKFATMLHKGGTYNGKRIIGAETIKFMIGARMDDMPKQMKTKNEGFDGYEYANLMRIMRDTSKARTISVEGEYGWDGWLGPYFINDPVHKVTILIMNQLAGAGTTYYTRKIRNIVYSSL